MKTSGLSFYFVLYVVAIITVFAITVERDRVLHERDDVIARLVSVSVRPLQLSAYVDTARFFIEPTHSLTRDSVAVRIKVEGPIDKSDVEFSLQDAKRIGRDGREEPQEQTGLLRNEEGDGVLLYPPLAEGLYEFKVSGFKRRIIVAGDTMRVRIGDTTYTVPYSEPLANVDRDTTVLLAKVEKSGIIPPQLTLNVQEAQDHWVLGPVYKKKVFVGGIEDIRKASFSVAAPARVELPPLGASYVTVAWDKPSLGKHSFNVSANANRGFGDKDRASVAFNVEVHPATFVIAPPAKGFWGIPYTFNGQLVGLNPLDLAVEILHDGVSLGVKPVVPPVTVTPERTWNSLSFKILYHEAVIKEHRAALSAPPPPQIRWVQQNLDRGKNVFTISVTSADPTGGPVRMSIESQPPGIAQLDKLRGTSFTVTVSLETKPNAVFLKLTAVDQYGGQSVSSKQFNIPQ
jgi:hypothetical protein